MHVQYDGDFYATRDDKGLSVLGLKPGTVLSVETANSVYRIKLLEDEEIEILGGMKANGDYRFACDTKAYLVGSFSPSSPILREGWVGPGMCMTIEVGEKQLIRTSPVKNVTVEGDGWSYSFDWDK